MLNGALKRLCGIKTQKVQLTQKPDYILASTEKQTWERSRMCLKWSSVKAKFEPHLSWFQLIDVHGTKNGLVTCKVACSKVTCDCEGRVEMAISLCHVFIVNIAMWFKNSDIINYSLVKKQPVWKQTRWQLKRLSHNYPCLLLTTFSNFWQKAWERSS